MCAFQRLFSALTDALGEEKVGREKPSKYINKLWRFQKFHFPQQNVLQARQTFSYLNKCFERQRFHSVSETFRLIIASVLLTLKSQQPADLWFTFGNNLLQINITFPGCKLSFANAQRSSSLRRTEFSGCVCIYDYETLFAVFSFFFGKVD